MTKPGVQKVKHRNTAVKRLAFWIAGLPLAVVIIALSVANRTPVTFSLDPVSTGEPVIKFVVPLYILLFGAGFAGLIIGWTVAFASQFHWRRDARQQQKEAEKWRNLATEEQKNHPSGSRSLIRAA